MSKWQPLKPDYDGRNDVAATLASDDFEAFVKWDGCCDIRRHHNDSTPAEPIVRDVDRIHICDLRDFIERLEQLEAWCKSMPEKNSSWFEGWDY